MSNPPEPPTTRPRVGVAAVITSPDGDRVLVGKRKGRRLMSGTWQFPGGHLEHGEGPPECAVRETLEETGLAVRTQGSGSGSWGSLVAVTNDVFVGADDGSGGGGSHYVTLFIRCAVVGGEAEAKVMEPDKCELWTWWDWDTLFRGRSSGWVVDGVPFFLPMENLVRQFESVGALKCRLSGKKDYQRLAE